MQFMLQMTLEIQWSWLKKSVSHWENDNLSRWYFSLDSNAVTLDSPDMAGGRELSRMGARKEKDLSP